MLKLVTAIVFLATAAARPGLLRTQTSLETIGAVVSSIPTSITHQSQSQIHSSILVPSITSIAVPADVRESRPLLSSQVISAEIPQNQNEILTGAAVNEQRLLLSGNQQEQLLSGQDQIDREQRLLTSVSRGNNQQELQTQTLSGQQQLIGEQFLNGRTSVVGNQEELLLNENDSLLQNQNINIATNDILSSQQLIGNGDLALNGRALLGKTNLIGGSLNTALRLGSFK